MTLKTKKKILLFIDWFTPGFRAGGPIASCVNLIDHLRYEFDFFVVTSDKDYMSDVPYKEIERDKWNVLHNGTCVFYFSERNLSKTAMKELIASLPFDKVYLNGIFSKKFTLLPLKLISNDKRKNIVVAARGMLAPSALNIKRNKKKIFLLYAKMTGLFSGITFH